MAEGRPPPEMRHGKLPMDIPVSISRYRLGLTCSTCAARWPPTGTRQIVAELGGVFPCPIMNLVSLGATVLIGWPIALRVR